jgi:arsenite-transporting ATPase
VNIKSKNLFFLGKGGTGKTTVSALTASALAEQGEKVVLLSMDPAHNLYDVFQVKSSKNAVKLSNRFIIEEIDIQYWIKTYLRSVEEKIAKSYHHLTALSLEKHINTIRYSPGLEEYAMQYAYNAVNKTYSDYTYRIFDMPPTALAVRFFNLHKITLVWLEQLIELRKKILEKQKIINNVRQGEPVKTDDKILNQLYKMQSDHKKIVKDYKDKKRSGMFIVTNEDDLSIAESKDIYGMILENKFTIEGILVNKYQNITIQQEFGEKIADVSTYFFPLTRDSLIGQKNLKEYLKNPGFRVYLGSILKPIPA